jgi:hypothetical protein
MRGEDLPLHTFRLLFLLCYNPESLEVNAMSMNTLEQVKSLINQLTPFEQEELLDYLKPRLAQTLAITQPNASREELDAAWQEFFKVGDEIAANDNANSETLTQSLLNMRR